jgi:hypothetical protein
MHPSLVTREAQILGEREAAEVPGEPLPLAD